MHDPARCRDLLRTWLARNAPEAAMAWFDATAAKIATGATPAEVDVALAMAARRVGKRDLALDVGDLADADDARRGWQPGDWSSDQAARIALLLAIADPATLAETVERTCRIGDVAELVTCYRGLPLYPEPERHLLRAREAARTHIKAVFDALAHRNPYPTDNFDTAAWNQLVLKALFIGSPLHPVHGLDARANADLARMLCDYAHERWAAGRLVSPELWRCVGPFADDAALDDLERVLRRGDALEREAAALALHACPDPRARELIARQAPDLRTPPACSPSRWHALACAP
jgi:hypothetical protein